MMQFKVFAKGGPEWCEKVLGKERAQMFYANLRSRVSADKTIEVSIEFRVQSLSSILAKAAEIDRLARLLDVVRQFPGIANRLRLDQLAKRMVDTLGYSSEDLMRPEAELQQITEMENMALQQLAMGAGQQPNSHTGNATAAAGIATPAGA
jgi:hypothetical protein